MSRKPPSSIIVGIRKLAEIEEVTHVGDLEWEEGLARWVARVELDIPGLPESEFVPRQSDWYVHIDPTYPVGKVRIYPAENGGIIGTFPHQLFNASQGRPWTKGEVCVARTGWMLNERGLAEAPDDASGKLSWSVQRLVEWTKQASKDALVQDGDPYELPPFPERGGDGLLVAFDERPRDLEEWSSRIGHAGYFEGVKNPSNESLLIVREFRGHNDVILHQPAWKSTLDVEEGDRHRGLWVLLESEPTLNPRSPPSTWGDLKKSCQDQGIDLVEKIEMLGDPLRDDKRHILLLGFPIPARFGEKPDRLHWQAILLPKLSKLQTEINGFRDHSALELKDSRMILRDTRNIEWVKSENWAPDQLQTRGAFNQELREATILLVGAGSLGSHVASQLVKGGVQKLIIFDGDEAKGGNLSRHILGLSAVGSNKANALAEYLDDLSIHTEVRACSENFPPSDEEVLEAVRNVDIVLDCTGSSGAAASLGQFPWKKRHLFVSASMGLGGHRLYFFSTDGSTFPDISFQAHLKPWLTDDRDRWGRSLAWEGIGCWHPVSVVREDDVALWASETCRHLDERVGRYDPLPKLDVLEKKAHQLGLVKTGVRLEDESERWQSDETNKSVLIHQEAVESLKRLCQEPTDREIGGILLGRYINGNTEALITEVGDPPPDSVRTPKEFTRGTKGVDEWLTEQYREYGRIYLGEWHFHPGQDPTPSPTDIATMHEIASDESYSCPEPILVVLGGPLDRFWVGAFDRKTGGYTELRR